MTEDDVKALLRRMMTAAIAAADPAMVLARHLPEKPTSRCIVIGAGKSAAAMARALEKAWPDVELSGIVVTRFGHAVPTDRISVREASHPVPDAAGLEAARDILQTAKAARKGDLVIALISGGGSALMPMPTPPLTLEEKITVNKLLLKSGLTIDDMNRVRRRLSKIKGGGLAQAASPARLVTLAISDVPGDDPAAVASGPTVPDPSSGDDLSQLVDRLGPDLPLTAREILLAKAEKTTDFEVDFRMIATPQMSLEAAATVAREAGVTPVLLGDALEGEARELGIAMAGIAKSVARHAAPARAPVVLLSGGETTVSIGDTSSGRGGRNTEFLLSLAIALNGHPGIHALAVDTDGIDGTEDAAGAVIGPDFLERAQTKGLDGTVNLRNHDSYSLFEATGDLIRTGPTLTNVNDFRAVVVL
ncbi:MULTISPECIES: glycerate kinase type-2 family protein [Primorskyibacter]|jgi:hydroxypyruvate reductase|uniref:glycerate kinase type-2 family protein n=1 Tax=Primorskyibacter TaxID=1068904 RepID=UPI0023019980|nr:glycerate kinase [Primorskyibacter aestuariivivens]MDA7429065.1 glycerate kinase [Primorskyibacter aestuariivivens]